MILALFGTNPYPFNRLVGFLERFARETGLEIVAQTGTSLAPKGCQSFSYASYDEIRSLMSKADVVVTQGGYGGCLDALSFHRPLIIVARRRDLGESLDDQTELADFLCASGRAQCVETYLELRAAIESSNAQAPDQTGASRPLGKTVATLILDYLNH